MVYEFKNSVDPPLDFGIFVLILRERQNANAMNPTSGLSQDQCIAVIPARGGSKELPGKNILPLAGKPLIAHTIEVARIVDSIGRVVVSTDCREIADIAVQYGAEAPFLRPQELARDDTPTLPVLQHALRWLAENERVKPQVIVLLQPTSPLRRAEDITRAVALLHETLADSVVSLCAVDHHPWWMKRLDGGRVRPFLERLPDCARRQDLPPVYRLNGAVYVTRHELVMRENRILGEDTRGFVMDEKSSVDIDTPLDLKIAALILEERHNASA